MSVDFFSRDRFSSAFVQRTPELLDHVLPGLEQRTARAALGQGADGRRDADAFGGAAGIAGNLGLLMAGKPDGCWRCEGVERLGHGAAFDASARAASSLRMSVLRPSAV